MTGYSEYRSYSPITDQIMSRLSMWGRDGREYYAFIPTEPAKVYRDMKKRAIEAIDWAIHNGLEPGEVRGF